MELDEHLTENKNPIDVWTVAAVCSWLMVFVIGLFPETVFAVMRDMGYVVTMRALINSHWFVTLACAGYLGWFVFARCSECGDSPDVAFGKSVQIIILGITAFLPLRIEQTLMYFTIPIPFYRYLILTTVAVKTVAWLYLLTLLLRYYLFSGHTVFRNIPLIFPSALFLAEEDENAPPSCGNPDGDA